MRQALLSGSQPAGLDLQQGLTSQYIAVHGGAGVHARENDDAVKRAMRRACISGIHSCERDAEPAIYVVAKAIAVLEDDEVLNAGYGSNLTIAGTVECDAALMDGASGDFGSVAALSGVKNPIRAALAVLVHSRVPDPLGRIPPMTLTSTGALKFAASFGVPIVSPEALITPHALAAWERWTARLKRARQAEATSLEGDNMGTELEGSGEGLHDSQDTVGAVVCVNGPDGVTSTAAGVSSGGLLLKLPGRVGEAAIFGAGCFAAHAIACSVSGAGEPITRAALARTIVTAISPLHISAGADEGSDSDIDVHGALETALSQLHADAGVLLLAQGRVWCAFTTESMAVAWTSGASKQKAKAKILRRSAGPGAGHSTEARVYITSFPLDDANRGAGA
ncbi:N-terminal nucleophile aminohydrolase [Athelia psychrophila]|uniref:N-terminal nucleophile aminohydrolase n=1 Tax=Athelia psychrophila TaxID=1759441 RepID=A0A166X2C8_9AGAM|nr:N-terminal nucleophile aminohydrolase [Fibularhizoctonia sp. CBS 109695]